MIQEVKNRLPNAKVNVSDLSVTRNMTSQTTLVVSEPELMRGFDYRAASTGGISLLIARDFSSLRHR